jgi:hypothetical protein
MWLDLESDIAEEFGEIECALSWRERKDLTVGIPLSLGHLDRQDQANSKRWAEERLGVEQERARRPVREKRSLRGTMCTPCAGLCGWCGELFERPKTPGRGAKFCSVECGSKSWKYEHRELTNGYRRKSEKIRRARVSAQRVSVVFTCQLCHGQFHRNCYGRPPVYCSVNCRNSASRLRRGIVPKWHPKTHQCELCSVMFDSKNPGARFCSRRCKDVSGARRRHNGSKETTTTNPPRPTIR